MLGDALANGFVSQGLMAGMGIAAIYTRPSASQTASISVIAQASARNEEYALALGSSPESSNFVTFTPEIGYCGFSVQVTDLAAFNPPVPQDGDTITIGTDVYALKSPDGLQAWSWEDLPFKTLLRCHTKKA